MTQSRRRTFSGGGLGRRGEAPPHVLARRGPLAWWSSLIAGALPALAFPEPGLWPLAYVGLVPLLLLIRGAEERRDAMVRAWLGGTAFLLATHHWLAPKAGVFLLVAVVALGTLWAAWGGAAHSLLRGTPTVARSLAAAAILPAGWVVIETIRSWESLGGPFGMLGAGVWNVRPLLSLAALGGVWILSFVAVAVNVAIALALVARRDVRVAAVGLGVAVLALASGPTYDALRSRPPPTRAALVAVVQVGLTDGPDERFASGVARTKGLAGEDLDLIVWGESSVGFDLNDRPDLLNRLSALSSMLDTPLLVNIDARRGASVGIYKSSVLIGPQGAADTYDKMRLVPFGEYIPLRSVLGWLSSVTDAAVEDRRRGRDLEIMEAGGIEFAPLICFESAFPDMARAVTAMGSDLLVYQSATTTFQDSWAPETHAGLAAVRAVETGRPVVHATLTGVTAAFDGFGRRLLWVGSEETGAYVVRLPLTGGTTAFVRFGDWVPVVSLAIVIAAATRIARTRRSRPQSPDRGPRLDS